MRNEVLGIVTAAVREAAQADGLELPASIDETTRLFGEGGLLDSMALVSLVIAVEQQIGERFNCGVALADEKALSQRSSPYRTIATLVDYALTQIENR
jgi:acyl carrier protein